MRCPVRSWIWVLHARFFWRKLTEGAATAILCTRIRFVRCHEFEVPSNGGSTRHISGSMELSKGQDVAASRSMQ